MSPARVQRKRTKGWRMPEGAAYVGRGSKWGNPFRPAPVDEGGMTLQQCINAYRFQVSMFPVNDAIRRELSGKDLACWCPLDQPCHADVLLELANQPTPETPGLTAHQEGTP